MQSWKLQDAKARFSEVVQQAKSKGPQEITLRGEPTVIVLSKEEYERLLGSKLSFLEFMRKSPLTKVELNIDRDPSLTREIDL